MSATHFETRTLYRLELIDIRDEMGVFEVLEPWVRGRVLCRMHPDHIIPFTDFSKVIERRPECKQPSPSPPCQSGSSTLAAILPQFWTRYVNRRKRPDNE